MDRIQERNTSFQVSVDPEFLRRKREETAVELRKKKRYEQTRQKRTLVVPGTGKPSDAFRFPREILDSNLECCYPALFAAHLSPIDRLKSLLVFLLSTNDTAILYFIVRSLRLCLALEKNPIPPRVFSPSTTQKILILLTLPNSGIQEEAIWVLINLASVPREHCKNIVAFNGVEILVGLLDSPHPTMPQHAAWVLANLVGDSNKTKKLAINLGVHRKILNTLASQNLTKSHIHTCI